MQLFQEKNIYRAIFFLATSRKFHLLFLFFQYLSSFFFEPHFPLDDVLISVSRLSPEKAISSQACFSGGKNSWRSNGTPFGLFLVLHFTSGHLSKLTKPTLLQEDLLTNVYHVPTPVVPLYVAMIFTLPLGKMVENLQLWSMLPHKQFGAFFAIPPLLPFHLHHQTLRMNHRYIVADTFQKIIVLVIPLVSFNIVFLKYRCQVHSFPVWFFSPPWKTGLGFSIFFW